MELEYDLGDGVGEIVGRVGRADVECPSVCGAGVALELLLAEIKRD